MGFITKTASICRICPYKDKCDNKRLESCAFVKVEKQNSAPLLQENTTSCAAPILRKHSYRDVRLDENTTVTIDLEEIKEQLRREFYRQAGLGIDYKANSRF